MSETTQFIEAEGVPQLFELNLLTAEHEEAWMEFLEHASQKNGQLADRWNTEWCARKERYEKRDQEILDLPLSIQVVEPLRFYEFISALCHIYRALESAYVKWFLASKEQDLRATTHWLHKYKDLKTRQEQIAASWLKDYPPETARGRDGGVGLR